MSDKTDPDQPTTELSHAERTALLIQKQRDLEERCNGNHDFIPAETEYFYRNFGNNEQDTKKFLLAGKRVTKFICTQCDRVKNIGNWVSLAPVNYDK